MTDFPEQIKNAIRSKGVKAASIVLTTNETVLIVASLTDFADDFPHQVASVITKIQESLRSDDADLKEVEV